MESKHICEVMKDTRMNYIEKKEKINNGVGLLESEVTSLVFFGSRKKTKEKLIGLITLTGRRRKIN